MTPNDDIEDMIAHRRQAALRGWTVGYADINEKWVLLCPAGNYRGSHDTADCAWRAAPKDRRALPRS